MEQKKSYLSKTLWVNFVVAGCALFAPGAGEYIQGHPEAVLVGFSVLNIVLRMVSKSKLELY